MQWVIQNSGVTFESLDRNVEPLVAAIDKLGHTRVAVGVIPFTDTIAGIEHVVPNIPTVFYGSTRLAEIAATLQYNPGVFYKKSWFNPANWVGMRDDLLNENQFYLNVKDLTDCWIDTPMFIKSIDPKVLTGMVIEGVSDREWWMQEHSHLKETDELVMSPIKEIEREWRFFIINNKVVTGSQYKNSGILRIREPIADEIWYKAEEMAKGWLPSPNIVMDVCKLTNGEYKIVEFNCVNCSGFYASAIEPFLKAVEDLV